MNQSSTVQPLKGKTAAIVTIGCRLNQADTALINGRLADAGCRIVRLEDGCEPDHIIVNTCCVTASASSKGRQTVRALRKKHPAAHITVTGCSTSAERSLWKDEGATDLVISGDERLDIARRLAELDLANADIPAMQMTRDARHATEDYSSLSSRASPSSSPDPSPVFSEGTTARFPFRSRAFLKIQDGCGSACTYCMVPLARGRTERSRDRAEIIREFRSLMDEGHREVVIAGVNICAYKDGGRSLYDLLSELVSITPDGRRIRLSSTEPHPETWKILKIMAGNPKICRFLHLPLQHGTDEILKAMGRNYAAADFTEFIHAAAESVPGIHLGTDVIAGFPGETDALFERSCRLIESLPLANLHIFRFSPRKGTPAADFAGKIPQNTIKRRAAALAALEEALTRNFLLAQVGRPLEVLVEKSGSGHAEGWSDNYAKVVIASNPSPARNSIVKAFIKGFDGQSSLVAEA